VNIGIKFDIKPLTLTPNSLIDILKNKKANIDENTTKYKKFNITSIVGDASIVFLKSKIKKKGIKYNAPIRFCAFNNVNGLYLYIIFLTTNELKIAANTAKNNKRSPLIEYLNVKSFSIMISNTPKKEIIIPAIPVIVIFSLRNKYEKIGVTTGIVEIITEATIDDTNNKPKLSPIKYKNG